MDVYGFIKLLLLLYLGINIIDIICDILIGAIMDDKDSSLKSNIITSIILIIVLTICATIVMIRY